MQNNSRILFDWQYHEQAWFGNLFGFGDTMRVNWVVEFSVKVWNNCSFFKFVIRIFHSLSLYVKIWVFYRHVSKVLFLLECMKFKGFFIQAYTWERFKQCCFFFYDTQDQWIEDDLYQHLIWHLVEFCLRNWHQKVNEGTMGHWWVLAEQCVHQFV